MPYSDPRRPYLRSLPPRRQRLAELLLVHIVLILADTDGFRIDLYELCQRILYTACDGSGASLSDIKIREFLRGQLACGINGSSCLVGDDILQPSPGFPLRSSTMICSDSRDAVPFPTEIRVTCICDELFQGFLCCTIFFSFVGAVG